MLPRPLLLIGCFLLAVFAGKAARDARVRPIGAHAGTPDVTAPVAPPMPVGMDDLATRTWLAENLPDADSARLKEIATRLAGAADTSPVMWRGLFSCWMEKDPATAWAFVAGNHDLHAIALEEWAAIDPASARAALQSPSADDLTALVRGAVKKDVVAGFRFLDEALAAGAEAMDGAKQRFGLDDRHFAELASKDPAAATAWVKRLKLHYLDGALFWGRWENNPAAAKEWLSQQDHPGSILSELAFFADDADHYRPALMDLVADAYPPGNRRNEAIQGLLENLAERDPDFAAREAARVIPDERMRAEAIAEIASLVAKTDFAKAWALLDTLDPSIQDIKRLDLPQIEVRPGEESYTPPWRFQFGGDFSCMRYLQTPGSVRSDLLDAMMETDKEAAIRLMDRIPTQELVSSGGNAIGLWMSRDYDEAVHWLAGKLGSQGDPEDLEDLVEHYNNVDEVHALIRSLPPGTVRTALVAEAVGESAATDPLAALDFAREACSAAEPVTVVYDVWAWNDPLAAMDHLANDDAAPAAAWEEVAEKAFKKDPELTAQAIENLPDGPSRDTAITTVVNSMVNADPVQASAWALALGDVAKRASAMESAINRAALDLRLARDPATAETLRQQLDEAGDLPEAERQRWLDLIDQEFTAP
jgi:hypothetical protein